MPRLRRNVWLAAAAALATGSLWAASTEVFSLSRRGAERALLGDETHAYPIDLRAGEYLHLRADQRGVDVELRLFDPAGRPLLRLDSPNGAFGPEDLFFCAERAGLHRVEVGLRGGPPGGKYRIAVLARRPATAVDRRRAAALRAFSQAAGLEKDHAAGPAAAEYLRSADLWKGLREEGRRAEALRRVAEIRRAAGALRGALALYRKALHAYQAAGDRRGQALMLNEIAGCHLTLDEPAPARDAGERALAGWRKIGDRDGISAALHTLGELSRRQGDLQAALSFFQEELEKAKSPEVRAQALISLGVVLTAVGDAATAQARCQEALALLQGPAEAGARARALTQLGNTFLEAGATSSALLALRTAWLALRRSGAIDRHDMAVTLASLGKVYFTVGDLRRARDYHQKALQLLAESGGGVDEITIWNNLGWIAEALGNSRGSLDAFQHVLPLARARGLREVEAATLLGMARVERRRGNPIAARALLEEALGFIESMRGEIVRPDWQISYFAQREDFYKLMIDLLMEQHRRQPASDGDLRAFSISERSRSLALLDRIVQGGAARTLSVPAVQSQILDGDTLLLEYYLSEPKSYLWVVSSGSMASFELPGREVIERQARQALSALSRRGSSPPVVQARLIELSRSLLAPVVGQLGEKRLLFVPHGALQSVPFATLADPDRGGGGWAPLLAHHEVVVLPSSSVLAALRQRAAARQTPSGKVALIGDPILSADDPLLPPEARSVQGPLEGGPLEPLPYAEQEIEAIGRLVPSRRLLKLLGFAANREQVAGDRLADYGILHFATHGLFDEEHPDGSALVLSRFDPAGGLRRGLLRAQDIDAMRLHASLVVLSACETARGREVRGEGVLGLTRSFLAAGADRVLVSLWKVDDRSTAVLMERFYRKLLIEGRAPAAALREAQLSMWREERWSRPYQWAGFLLQGRWD